MNLHSLYDVSEWESVSILCPSWYRGLHGTFYSYLLHPDSPVLFLHWKAGRKSRDKLKYPCWLAKAGDQPVLEVNPTCSCRAACRGRTCPAVAMQTWAHLTPKHGGEHMVLSEHKPTRDHKRSCRCFLGWPGTERNQKNGETTGIVHKSILTTGSSHSFSKFMLKLRTQTCFPTNAEKIFRAQPSVQLVYWKCLTDITVISFWFRCDILVMLSLSEILPVSSKKKKKALKNDSPYSSHC